MQAAAIALVYCRSNLRAPEETLTFSTTTAVRTAKWPPRESGDTTSDRDMEVEVDNALVLANRVFGALLARHENLFPHTREPWFQPSDEDVPK
jgi:hypothetical protein